MAFFGLTALGPQNSFQDALKSESRLRIFEKEDIEAAFRQVELRAGEGVDAKDTVRILEHLYRGPVPDADGALCCRFLPQENVLTEDVFVTSLQSAQAHEEETVRNNEGIVSSGCEYASNQLFREYASRHVRLNENPTAKYAKPLTASMEFGWTAPDKYEPLVAPKQSCEETVYQAELIKAGVYY